MEPERPRLDAQSPPDDDPSGQDATAPARPPLLDPPVAVEAVFAFLLSGLLCWNAWPWIAAQAAGETGTPGGPSAIIGAVLLYGLAWPAIAAATMGALHYALRGLAPRLRLTVSGGLLVALLIGLLMGD
ncbi:MAG: hypothetical protein ACK5X5_10745 [bacterium]|jgi:hypothetical protein|nr:hypothetical protein [Betaproteobacteria bacterium]